MAINTFFKAEMARGHGQDPLTIWAKDVILLARISIALNCKKPSIAVEKYEVKGRRIA